MAQEEPLPTTPSSHEAAPQTSVRRALATNLFGQGLTIGLSLLGNVFVVRLMGAEVATYFLFIATTTLLSFFLDPLGMKWAATYLVGREPLRARRVLMVAVLSSLVAASCIVVFGPHVLAMGNRWLPGQKWTATAMAVLPFTTLIAAAMAINLMQLVTNAILLGIGRYAAYNIQQSIAAGLFAVGTGILLSHNSYPGPRPVILLWIGGVATGALFGILTMLDILIRSEGARLPMAELSTGIRAYGLNGLSYLHQRIDFYMVAWFLGGGGLALYGTAVSICESLGRSSSIVGSVVYSKSVTERDSGFRSLVPRLMILVMGISCGLGFIFLALGQRLIPLVFGIDFAGAYRPAAALIPGIICLGGTSVLNNFFSGKGYPYFMVWSALAALAINVGLNITLIPKWGIVGAATASSCSYALWFGLLVVIFRHRPSHPFPRGAHGR